MFWSSRLCRICATVAPITYPIFSNNPSKDIEAKFKKCFQINVYKDDFKPKEICNTCLDKLNDYNMFLELCIASNIKFESIIYQTNRSELQDNWHNRIDYKLSSDLFSPTENGVIVKSDDLMLITQYKNDLLNIEMQNQIIETQNVSIHEELDNLEQLPQNQTVLRHSSEFFKSNDIHCALDEFQYNCKKKSDELYVEKCVTSDVCINISDKNKSEDTYVEKNVTPEACINTDKTNIPNEIEKSAEKIKPFKCMQCNKSFMRKLTLKAHMSSHTNIKPYHCELCNKSFPLRCALTYHKKVHSNIFQCEFCYKSFPAASKLQRHIRTHTNDRPFKCEVEGCNKMFSDKRNLVGHQVTHTKIRNFFCDICKKCYKTKSQLKDHQKAHSNINFSCDICGKTFKWKTNLIVHLKKHSEFHCKKCKVDFRNRSMFLMHKNECEG